MYNKQLDQSLNIETEDMINYYADLHHNRYEATDYRVLDAIINSNIINKDDVVIDYGCGKCRVGIYLHHQIGCKVIGIEYNDDVYFQGLENISRNHIKDVTIIQCDASTYEVDSNATIMYFFNPFSVETLLKVLHQIKLSYYSNERDIYLLFYYPSDDYVAYLMNHDDLTFYKVISTKSLFNTNDTRENVLIFKLDI